MSGINFLHMSVYVQYLQYVGDARFHKKNNWNNYIPISIIISAIKILKNESESIRWISFSLYIHTKYDEQQKQIQTEEMQGM